MNWKLIFKETFVFCIVSIIRCSVQNVYDISILVNVELRHFPFIDNMRYTVFIM